MTFSIQLQCLDQSKEITLYPGRMDTSVDTSKYSNFANLYN